MKHSNLFIAAALVAVAGCSNQLRHTGPVVEYGANSTGTTPGWENTSPYPKDPSNAGFATSVPPQGASAAGSSR
jgi:hypothetical protein